MGEEVEQSSLRRLDDCTTDSLPIMHEFGCVKHFMACHAGLSNAQLNKSLVKQHCGVPKVPWVAKHFIEK